MKQYINTANKQLNRIINNYKDSIDISRQELLELIAKDAYELGVTEGRLAEKENFNNKLDLASQGLDYKGNN